MNAVAHVLSWLRCKWPIVALLLISGALNFYHLDWGLPNGAVSWAHDAITPTGPLYTAYTIANSQFWRSRYPAGHHVLLLAIDAPYIAYLHLKGAFGSFATDYPYGFSDPERSLTVLFLADRAVSAIMGVGIVLLLYLIGRRRSGELAGLFSAAAIALNVIFIYHSHTTNVDIPYLFWMMLALYFFDRALESGELRHFVLLSLFGAVSLCTKESVVGVLVGMAIPLVWVVLRERRWKGHGVVGIARVIGDKRLLTGLATFLITFGLVGCSLTGVGYWFAKYGWAMANVEGSIAHSEQGIRDLVKLPGIANDVVRSFGLPLCLFLFIGAIWACLKRGERATSYLVLMVSYYLVFQRNYWDAIRFSMPQMVFLALLGAPFIAYLIQGRIPFTDALSLRANRVLRLAPARAMVRVIVAGVLGYTVLHAATLPWLLSRDSRYAAEAWLQKNARKGQTIEFLSPFSIPIFRPPQWMTVRIVADPKDMTPEKLAASGADLLAVDAEGFAPERCPDEFRSIVGPMAKALESGESGYERAAVLKTRPLLDIPLSHYTINPLIVIYRKSASANPAAQSLHTDGGR
ncbi:MAG: glycosyltransferase family 39 protein [Candidatus Coatesbacteria bacterium]|nr:glycosyltransferase family 39 protein [Candidatus Coatesbacteria bacterium]